MSQSIPHQVLDLIARFERNRDSYKSPHYNETQLRREFLDPLFKALGWDIDNEKGYAEAYKDVIHEDAIKVGEATKAPDYCFRIGGARKFFLEAKKPSIDIKNDTAPAFQLRRYAWTSKLPIGILSDFEEFSVYDCRVKPYQNDKAAVARILYLPYTDYVQRWDEIAGIFSRDAVLKGSFDKYAESNKVKRGTADVDDEFLKTIEGWRSDLARNLALRNPKLTQRELNFVVQRIIDRIIFLRICEGRGIENYGRLQALTNGDRIYPRLSQMFEEADARYNSGLFHFKPEKNRHEAPDELTLSLEIDDKLLRELIKSIYYPESPYVFSALPAEILGQVYEQFLGKIIRLTEGHHAVVEEKPEVKKAGGVYYTPSYIVDYIVQNTVGKLLEEIAGPLPMPPLQTAAVDESRALTNTPIPHGAPAVPEPETVSTVSPKSAATVLRRVSKLKILDPACGSGSFLIGAYEHLLKWHLNYYTANDPAKWVKGSKPALVQVSGGRYRLTIAERKRILLDNIFGVDIDPQAVETTKLSLLLKVLEGETQQTLQLVLRMFQERALPDLGDNIKCGNSLIGSDFYQQQQLNFLTDEERYRINVFDWDGKDGFPKIMAGGGFDAVIGNPPYVLLTKGAMPQSVIDYLLKYAVSAYKGDLFHVFIERGIQLLRKDGVFGYIVPNPWLTMEHSKPLRTYVLHNTRISEIDIMEHNVFRSAKVHTALLFLLKGAAPAKWQARVKTVANPGPDALLAAAPTVFVQSNWQSNTGQEIETRLAGATGILVKRLLREFPPLGEMARASLGCQAYNSSKHTADQIARRVFHSPRQIGPEYMKELAGKDVGRYEISAQRGEWIKYGPWLHDYRTIDWLQGPRILIREIPGKPPRQIMACYVEETYCHYKTILNINPSAKTTASMKYFCGLLNSRLLSFLYPFMSNKMVAHTFPRISVGDLRRLPIATAKDEIGHNRVVTLVESMLDLHKRLQSTKTPQEKVSLERQIAATDAQIDKLVYELYGLTDDEIKIVEGKSDAAQAGVAPEQLIPAREGKSSKSTSSGSKSRNKTPAYAKPPPKPAAPNLTPEQAYGDAAHYFSAKEEPPPSTSN